MTEKVKSVKSPKVKKDKNAPRLVVASLEDAIKKVQELSVENKRKFVESVDIAVNLGVDSKQSDQAVKGSILLPNGSGKKVKVIVFTANDDLKKAALDAGATHAGLDDLVAKIEGGFLDFDCCVATPDVMQKISKVAKKLGPRGLMPSPKNGTVTPNVVKAVADAMKGKADFKNDKAGIVHCIVGKVDFTAANLLENIRAVVKAIKDAKPENAKGKFIKSFYISATMGRSVGVATESL